MMMLNALILVAALLMPATQQPAPAMKADVDRLVRAAEQLTGVWPTQPPPPIPEVALVARHGKAVVPLLTALLSDDPNAERDQKRWKVQQQAALALCRIYAESTYYCPAGIDGDLPERNANAKKAWLAKIAQEAEMQALSANELLGRFKREKLFFLQFDLGRALAATGDRRAIVELESWLTLDDRHARGNAAFVLARLGDPRGFETIAQILSDRSPRPIVPGALAAPGVMSQQIASDRYYAAHLLGDLKDPRGVPLLVPLLDDEDVNWIVPWSLGRISDPRAVAPLMRVLDQDDPSMRVMAISALEAMHTQAALPKLRELLQDDRKSNFDHRTTVAEAARHAIATISQPQ